MTRCREERNLLQKQVCVFLWESASVPGRNQHSANGNLCVSAGHVSASVAFKWKTELIDVYFVTCEKIV